MKKLLVAFAAVAAVAAFAVGSVSAGGDGGKIVAEGFACGILDGNGNVVLTTNSTLTVYANRSILRCSGTVDAGPPPHPKFFNAANTGLGCNMLEFGATRDWVDKVGAAGNSQLTCYGPATAPDAAAASGAGIG